MLESQRISLLNAMGMKTVQPRFQLSAAKPSLVLVPEASKAPAPQPESESVQPAATVVEKAANILRDQQMQAAVSTLQEANPKKVVIPEEKTSEKKSEKPLRFRLRLVRCGEFMMIMDQPALKWQDEKQAQAFFADIYFALYKKRPEFYATDEFVWPPTKNFPNAHDATTARATFSGFLQPKMTNPECLWLVCWGESAAKYLLEDAQKMGELTQFQDSPVLIADELLTYWQQPLRKKILWADLKNLFKMRTHH